MRAWLSRPVDAISLTWARVTLGLILSWEAVRYAYHGRIHAYYIEPGFTFPYFGFGWVQPLPGDWMVAVFGLIFIAGICVALGLVYRLASVLLFVSLSYVFLLDEAQYLNHIYLCCLLCFLLCFLPANRAHALDTRLGLSAPAPVVPAWTLALLRWQVGLVYFWGGVAKLNGDWLSAMPLLDWMEARRGMAVVGPLLAWDPTAWLMSYAGLLLDLLLFPLLSWRRSRPYALAAAILFHVLNAAIFTIGIFPFLMVAWTLLFLEPAQLRGLLRRPQLPSLPAVRPLSSAGVVLLGLWLAVQMALPLRHWAYPGDVAWTEEGHRFSWRMKLRSKQSNASFVARDVDTGQEWKIRPTDLLTRRQARKMSTRPDMIVLFAHHIEAQLRARGHREVEVRALVMASLNGRKKQLLIDPDVDLTQEERVLWPAASWIVPLSRALHPGDRRSHANSGGQ